MARSFQRLPVLVIALGGSLALAACGDSEKVDQLDSRVEANAKKLAASAAELEKKLTAMSERIAKIESSLKAVDQRVAESEALGKKASITAEAAEKAITTNLSDVRTSIKEIGTKLSGLEKGQDEKLAELSQTASEAKTAASKAGEDLIQRIGALEKKNQALEGQVQALSRRLEAAARRRPAPERQEN